MEFLSLTYNKGLKFHTKIFCPFNAQNTNFHKLCRKICIIEFFDISSHSETQNTSGMIHYTSKEVNRNFKIKVSGLVNDNKVNTLVGFSGFLSYVNNDELAERLLDRAFSSTDDKCLCKLRRGIMISFYAA